MPRFGPLEQTRLFVATLYSDGNIYLKARSRLIAEFGELLSESNTFPWEHSEHYRDELGWPIIRQFLAFNKSIDPLEIREIKLLTNKLEESFSTGKGRAVNLDPGYVTPAKVVLATTKNFVHRIYIGKGIYAEVTLFYNSKEKAYRPHEYTYMDYRRPDYNEFLLSVRADML